MSKEHMEFGSAWLAVVELNATEIAMLDAVAEKLGFSRSHAMRYCTLSAIGLL